MVREDFGALSMLNDVNGNPQAPMGTTSHWKYLRDAMLDPVIYGPLHAEVVRVVDDAIAANPARPFINSRVAGADAFEIIGGQWHAEFPRHFPNFPNGADRGLFGMSLWYYLVGRQDHWRFMGFADPYGYGQDAKQYWRV